MPAPGERSAGKLQACAVYGNPLSPQVTEPPYLDFYSQFQKVGGHL